MNIRLFFIIGDNQLLLEEKIKKISNNYHRLSFANDELAFFNLLEQYTNQNLFGLAKDLVLQNLEKLKKESWQRLANLTQENKQLKFIFLFKEERTEIFEIFKRKKTKFEIINIKTPKVKDLEKFIENYSQEHQSQLPKEIIYFFKENYQENISLLIQSLNNIFILKKNKHLKIDDIKNLVHLQTNIFKIHDYLLEKKWSVFIHTFKKFISYDKSYNKNDTLQALSFFINSLIRIYLIKTKKKIDLKLNPYYLRKLTEKSQQIKTEEVKNLIRALARTDRKFKKFIIKINEIPEDIVLNYILNQKLSQS